MNAVQHKPEALEVHITMLGVRVRATQRHPLWSVMHFKSIWVSMLSSGVDTLFFNVMQTEVRGKL